MFRRIDPTLSPAWRHAAHAVRAAVGRWQTQQARGGGIDHHAAVRIQILIELALGGETLGRLGARYCRQWLGRASPSIFCFALLAFGARKRRAFFVVVTRCDRAGRSISLSARFDVNAMTATLKQSQTPTDFDWAVFSAVAAGWTGRPAFDAVCCMLASGMTASQIEKAFNDARTRIQ